jgi:uncharacterized protein (TIGR03067 family)
MKYLLMAFVCFGLVLVSGCTTVVPADFDSIQGTWKGQEVREGRSTLSFLTLTGRELEFRTANNQEWYKGTFHLGEKANPKQLVIVITQSSTPQSAGKTVNAIYELHTGFKPEDGNLVITGNEPGNPEIPTRFGARHARQIVFTR